MIKILQVIGGLRIGGAETVAMNILRNADCDEYLFHYLVFGNTIGEYESEVTSLGGKVIHMKSPSSSYKNFYKNLTELIHNEKYDAVHCHTLFSSGLVMKIAAKNNVKVRITHSHSIKNSVSTSLIRVLYEKMARKLIIKYSTHLFACSDAAGDMLFGNEVYINKGVMINNGVDTNKHKYDQISRNEIRSRHSVGNKILIGHVGHMIEVKNQMFLIDIFEELIRINSDYCMVLIGDGEDREKIFEKAKSMNLHNNIIFTGNISEVDLYLNAMDVFVFPSLYEGLPLALVEAQTNGLPCIISDTIPTDVKLTDLVEFVSLKELPSKWADIISRHTRCESVKYSDVMKDVGFDMASSINILLKTYSI